MDSQGGTSPRTSHASSNTSETLAGSPQPVADGHDHEDSPMRKKPRLDSAAPSSMAAESDDAAAEGAHTPRSSRSSSKSHPGVSPQPTSSEISPSKVTLNLRSLNSDKPNAAAVEHRDQPPSEHKLDRMPRERSSPLPHEEDGIAILDASNCSPPARRSPPVVDISLDDASEEDEHPTRLMNEESQFNELMYSFPGLLDHGLEDAVRAYIALVEDNRLQSSYIEQIAEWMSSWTHFISDKPQKWSSCYRKYQEFWILISLLVHKILIKKYSISSLSTSRTAFAQMAFRLLESYVIICSQVLSADLHNIRQSSNTHLDFLHWNKGRYLRSLSVIFSRLETTTIWRIATDLRTDEASLALTRFAEILLIRHTNSLGDYFTLASTTAGLIESDDGIRESLLNLIRIGNTALAQLFRRPEHVNVDQEHIQRFQISTIESVETMLRHLFKVVEKQTAAVNAEFAQNFIEALSTTWRYLMSFNPADLKQALKPWQEIISKVSNARFADIQCIALQLTAFRKLVAKGRMELRVLGAHKMGVSLLDMFSQTKEPPNDVNAEVRQLTADWLFSERVVEQLVSIDSHPGVVSQSSNILGYLIATSTWTKSMTDAVFGTVQASQDPRLTSSILDVMRNTANFAYPYVILDIFEHISSLPIATFTPSILQFLNELAYSNFHKTDCTDLLSPIFRTTVPLLRHLTQQPSNDGGNLATMDKFIIALISSTASLPYAGLEKQRVCQDCVSDIQTGSRTSAGSARVIEAILQATRDDLLVDFIVWEIDTPTALSQCLISLVNSGRNDAHGTLRSKVSFPPLLRLLVDLMVLQPRLTLPSDVEAELWQSLVGANAIDEQFRNDAWLLISRLCIESTSLHPFVERCIREYLPAMNSESFAMGLVEFVHRAISYRMRISSLDESEKPSVIKIPLVDYLWKIVLNCQSDEVARAATSSLCDYHVRSGVIKASSLQAILDCHEAFVDKSICQLEDSAKVLRRIREPHEHDDSHSYLDASHETIFKRTIDCLQRFLEEVQLEQGFILRRGSDQSVSSESINGAGVEESIPFKFQAFPPGQNIESLTMPSSASLHDLYEALQAKTRFPDFRTICGGQNVDLKGQNVEKVKSVANKGLIIVQHLGSDKLLPPSPRGRKSTSTAGKAIFSRFERLYRLLDLSDIQSSTVFELMKTFPAYLHTQDALESDVATLSGLFHPERRYKTLYTLHCVLKILPQLDSRTAREPRYIQNVSRKVFTAFANPSIAILVVDAPADKLVTEAFCQCLLQCLKRFSRKDMLDVLDVPSTAIILRLCDILERAHKYQEADHGPLLRATCDSIVQLAAISEESIQPFAKHNSAKSIHKWLLIKHPDFLLRNHGQHCVQAIFNSLVGDNQDSKIGLWSTYWDTLLSLVPTCPKYPAQSQPFFQLMTNLTPLVCKCNNEPLSMLHLDEWFSMLLSRQQTGQQSREDPEPFVAGLGRLISVSLISSPVLLEKVDADSWISAIFDSLLFPSVSSSTVGRSHYNATSASVLDSDSRKELYDLVTILCRNHADFTRVLKVLEPLTNVQLPEEILSWDQDRNLMLRSTGGYSGLRNLTNTCYMNSLVTQLFMNSQFRRFIMEVPVIDEHGSQKLLGATQNLFRAMIQSQRRYADTEEFAYSVKPYDAPTIDVTIQMDVDEFYNLLFEQWESQITDKDMRNRFRSIYGGSSVTQIKSLDCSHVSERLEEYLTVSCEVKGKHSLHESLQAFIAGDSMEGDNKYKCESCGDRYVNAVKRSCLRDIPDHLTFHLKRFDFDLLSLQRCKIHDYFNFPPEIDMAPYTYKALVDGSESVAPDVFELSGILVHSGSAEAGHYYSYIRDGQNPNSGHPRWLEFNDTDVTEFDPGKIPDCCYGGTIENEQFRWPKPHCAYMLFYNRRRASKAELQPTRESTNHLEEIPIGYVSQDPLIAKENDLLMRWYCLMDPQHGVFLRTLMTKLEEMNKSRNAQNHEDHPLTTKLAAIALDYLHKSVSKTRFASDFESTAFGVESLGIECPQCSFGLLKQITNSAVSPMADMLIRCPIQKVRLQTADLVHGLLKAVRDEDNNYSTLYGIPGSSPPTLTSWRDHDGCFTNVVHNMVSQMESIGGFCRFWDEYFDLFFRFAEMGQSELTSLLLTRLLENCLALIYTCDPPQLCSHEFFEISNRLIGRNRKFASYTPLLRLIAKLLERLNPEVRMRGVCAQRIELADPESGLLPVTEEEYELMHLWEGRSYAFLVKCLEATNENESALAFPARIVASMVKDSNDLGHFHRIVTTITRSIDEYYHNFQHLPLALALPLCEYAPTDDYVRKVLASVRAKVGEFERAAETSLNVTRRPTDFDSQNGEAILTFWKQIASMQNPQCVSPDSHYPFRPLVQCTLVSSAPRLLHFDEPGNREHAVRLVDEVFLYDFPSSTTKDVELVNEDKDRISWILQFIRQCVNVYSNGRRFGTPATTRTQLIEACTHAITLLQRTMELELLDQTVEDDFAVIMEKYTYIVRDHENDLRSLRGADEEGDTEAMSEPEDNEDDEGLDVEALSPSINESPS